MATRRVHMSPALAGALVAPALLLSLSAGPALAPTAATAATGTPAVTGAVANGSFEHGIRHWSAERSKVRLSTSSDSWHGKRALKAKARKHTALRIRSERPVQPDTRGKLRWTMRVKPTTGQRVTLTVVERTAAGKRKKHRTSTWAPARSWTKVRVTAKHRADSRLRPVLRTPAVRRGEAVLVDAARVRAVAQRPGAPAQSNATSGAKAGQLSNGCAYTTRGLPKCGAYLGMAYGSNTDPAPLEAEMGAQVSLRRTYYRADQVASAVRTAKADIAKGRLPWVSFKFPHGWEAMASGQGDAWAKSLARQFAALDGPVWLAFHHEPENDGDMQAWRRAQERLAPIVRGAGDNLAFTVVLTGWHQFYGAAEFSLGKIWPRRVNVDVAGFDVYNSHGVVKDGKEMKPTDMDGAYFAKIDAWADKQGVAWGLAETGFNDKAFKEDPNWVRRTHRQLEQRGGVAMAYFNTTLNSISSWSLGEGKKWESFRDATQGTPRLPRP